MSAKSVKKEIIFFAELGIDIIIISEEMVSPNQLPNQIIKLPRDSVTFNCQFKC